MSIALLLLVQPLVLVLPSVQVTLGDAASAFKAYHGSSIPPERDDKLNMVCSGTGVGNCATGETCVDYGALFTGNPATTFCDCEVPTDSTNCYCELGTASKIKLRRWEFVAAKSGTPSGNLGSTGKWPAAGFNHAGCYLQEGETCKSQAVGDATSETYKLCKWGYYCNSILGTTTTGFCRKATASQKSFPAFTLIFALFVSVNCLL